jgi:predicted dehydrogenase
MKSEKLRWGILATGGIANTFARGVSGSRLGQLVAVGSRTQKAAEKFGAQHRIGRCHGSYEALLADTEVDAVYIATPHPLHAEWAIQAAESGKHILCEKPLTVNHNEAEKVVEAARRHHVSLMEGFMYRCHPQTSKLVELIQAQTIGEVRVIKATFSFQCACDPGSRLLSNALGGGGILDVGCYCVSMARLLAGVARGLSFADPVHVDGAGHVGATHVDEWAIATLKFPGGIVAQLSTGIQVNQDNEVFVYGSEGQIRIPSPWLCAPTDGAVRILLERRGEPNREIIISPDRDLYAYEADAFAETVRGGRIIPPLMSPDDSLGNMKTLDQWRTAVGMSYDTDR